MQKQTLSLQKLGAEIDTISENIARVREIVCDPESITIRAQQLYAIIEALAPIRCVSPECLYNKTLNSCFINPVQLNKGICPYYNPESTSANRADMPDRFPVNRKTSPPKDQSKA